MSFNLILSGALSITILDGGSSPLSSEMETEVVRELQEGILVLGLESRTISPIDNLDETLFTFRFDVTDSIEYEYELEEDPTSFIRVTLEDLKQDLIDKVIDQIKTDINEGDTTVLEELLKAVPTSVLLHSLPEEQWDGFKLLTN